MSGGVSASGGTDYSLMTTLISDGAAVKQRLDKLTDQAGDGLVATTYAGLGDGAAVSLNLAPQISALQTWQNNIQTASGNMQVTQTAMTQLQQIASNFLAQTSNLEGSDASEVDSIAASAQQALVQVAGLLDTQDAGVYVFGGQDSSNPPVPDPDSILTSGFYTQINAAVGALSANGASATTTATLAIASDNAPGTSPFSAYLSQPASALQGQTPSIQIGPGQAASVGILASSNAAVTSGGTSTTQSYTRDLMRALATIGSLSSTQVNDPGFQAVVQDTNASLTGAISAMAQDAGVLGNTQASLTAAGTGMADTVTALTAQVSSAQDVDMAATLSNLSLVQTQLQASYQLISGMSSLSLVKFLPVG
jgi:flagellin-like hook-associated protein FlgL